MPKNTGGRKASRRGGSTTKPGGSSYTNSTPIYDLNRVRNLQVHNNIQTKDLNVSNNANIPNRLTIPIIEGDYNFYDNSLNASKGEIFFDISNNKMWIADISGNKEEGVDISFQAVKFNL